MDGNQMSFMPDDDFKSSRPSLAQTAVSKSKFQKVNPPQIFKCADYWKNGRLGTDKLEAYRQAMKENKITLRGCVYSNATGERCVEYISGIPHEWILKELHDICERIKADSKEQPF